jgi:hypothetical protein
MFTEDICIAMCMALFKAELNLSRFGVCPVLFKLKVRQLHLDQGPDR